MAPGKRTEPTLGNAIAALIVGVPVTALSVYGLYVGLRIQSESIDSNAARLVLGIGMISIGLLDLYVVRRKQSSKAVVWLRRGAKLASVTSLLASLYWSWPDESRRNRATMYMRRQLENLADAESAYFAKAGRYSTNVDSLQTSVNYHLVGQEVSIVHADSASFRAVASDRRVTRTCTIEAVRRSSGRTVRDLTCTR